MSSQADFQPHGSLCQEPLLHLDLEDSLEPSSNTSQLHTTNRITLQETLSIYRHKPATRLTLPLNPLSSSLSSSSSAPSPPSPSPPSTVLSPFLAAKLPQSTTSLPSTPPNSSTSIPLTQPNTSPSTLLAINPAVTKTGKSFASPEAGLHLCTSSALPHSQIRRLHMLSIILGVMSLVLIRLLVELVVSYIPPSLRPSLSSDSATKAKKLGRQKNIEPASIESELKYTVEVRWAYYAWNVLPHIDYSAQHIDPTRSYIACAGNTNYNQP
ncbi:hypothetical protein BDZ45DRAFT_762844 [Acephala macrosclerotiorum]|nr:hypothetical protein BDZ45DRAFT_762844 [Acephala macrosclerotiorum]